MPRSPSASHVRASSSRMETQASPRHIMTVLTISMGAHRVRLMMPATAPANTSLVDMAAAEVWGARRVVMAYARPARAPMVGMALRATLRLSLFVPFPPRGILAAALSLSQDSPSAESAVAVCFSPTFALCGRMAALPLTDRRFAAICAPIKGLLLFAPAAAAAVAAAAAGPTVPRGAVRAALGTETLIRLVLLVVAKEYDAC
mmetsp:Transcript_636/g.1509  ORF Transcript_636/g.1509 Transcript_636/m.1509 type:complete len:203 (-) Transcript_636:147-755(-)